MAKYKIIHDSEDIYHKGEIYDGKELISKFIEYIETCNEMEDADFIGYIHTIDEDEAIGQICDFWDMQMEKIN